MKLINLNFIVAVLLLAVSDEYFTLSKSLNINQNKDLSINILSDMKTLNLNITNLYSNLSNYLNNTKKMNNDTQYLSENIDYSLASLEEFHTYLDNKIKIFENKASHNNIIKQKNLKKRKTLENNRFNFYNSISLIMLGLLAGGLVGVVFILYFSFKTQETN
jgi:hypothetical protein